jgi:hypothetical protein
VESIIKPILLFLNSVVKFDYYGALISIPSGSTGVPSLQNTAAMKRSVNGGVRRSMDFDTRRGPSEGETMVTDKPIVGIC